MVALMLRLYLHAFLHTNIEHVMIGTEQQPAEQVVLLALKHEGNPNTAKQDLTDMH